MTTRLGLPWHLDYYKNLNGAHPLVDSYVRGNAAVQTMNLELVDGPEGKVAVLESMAEQRALLSEVWMQWTLLHNLNLEAQIALEAHAARYDRLFLHTTPLYAGSQPWIFHFESFSSLFFPFMVTGENTGVDLKSQDFYWLVQAQLESPKCLRIFSHMRESLEILNRVSGSTLIAPKCHYVPLGIDAASVDAAMAKFDGRPLRILFTNSLHRLPRSFYSRGGHHLLEAFARLRKDQPDAELTVVSSVPDDLMERFTQADLAGVTWIDERLDDAELDALFLAAHVFALPAAGLHSHSLLRALAHGCVPLVSDAPGYDEYTQEISVLRLRGVRAMVYRDEPDGWISERYEPFLERSAEFVEQIYSLMTEAAPRMRDIGAAALDHCRQRYSVAASHAAFNRMLRGDCTEPD